MVAPLWLPLYGCPGCPGCPIRVYYFLGVALNGYIIFWEQPNHVRLSEILPEYIYF